MQDWKTLRHNLKVEGERLGEGVKSKTLRHFRRGGRGERYLDTFGRRGMTPHPRNTVFDVWEASKFASPNRFEVIRSLKSIFFPRSPLDSPTEDKILTVLNLLNVGRELICTVS